MSPLGLVTKSWCIDKAGLIMQILSTCNISDNYCVVYEEYNTVTQTEFYNFNQFLSDLQLECVERGECELGAYVSFEV